MFGKFVRGMTYVKAMMQSLSCHSMPH